MFVLTNKNSSMETKKITVSDEDLRRGAEEGMDAFLKVFTDKYIEVTGGEISQPRQCLCSTVTSIHC